MTDTSETALHRSRAEMDARIDDIRSSPVGRGTLELIARRPGFGTREVLEEAEIDLTVGLVGDTWKRRTSRSTPDRRANPLKQITVMNARAAAAIAGSRDRWPLAGDQLYVDMDLSLENLPPGSVLRIGGVLLEVSPKPHRGCAKFSARFGPEALALVNSDEGRAARLRGLNARVIGGGAVRVDDRVVKAASGAFEAAPA